jgi:hypothetical protein
MQKIITSFLALAVLSPCLSAQSKPPASGTGNQKPSKSQIGGPGKQKSLKSQIGDLRKQIAALEADRKAALRKIKELYGSLFQRDRLDEAQVRSKLVLLKEQEAALLALATNDAQRTEIQNRFRTLGQALSGEVQLDESQMIQLGEQERLAVQQVNALYQTRINQLKAQIQALERGNTGTKNPSNAPLANAPKK